MLLFNLPITDVSHALAAEEHVFRTLNEPCFMLWSCHPAVVVGVNQVIQAEIDYRYAVTKGIALARRMSGGGAVYHDAGNLNFTFIENLTNGQPADFKAMLTPIIGALRETGLHVDVGNRNELLLGNDKISGSAGHVALGRALLHGTLLFDADLTVLDNLFKKNNKILNTKAVASVPHKVGNIKEHVPTLRDIEHFRATLFAALARRFPENREYRLCEADMAAIEQIARTKYDSWEWTYGRSPRYEIRSSLTVGTIDVSIIMNVKNGLIQSAEIHTMPETPLLNNLAEALTGCRHQEEAMLERIVASLKDEKQTTCSSSFFPDSSILKMVSSIFA